MKVNVFHITQSEGGVQSYILNILNYSNKDIFNHTVICSSNGMLAQKAASSGANIFKVKMVREISPIHDLKALFLIYRLLKKHRPSIIHAHSAKGGMYGRICGHLLNIPVIFTPHAYSYLAFKGIKNKILIFIERVLALTNSFFLPSSFSEADRAEKEIYYNKRKILKVFYNSIPIDNSDSKIIVDEKLINVLSLARISYQKNPELFVEVVLKVRERIDPNIKIKFIMVGAGFSGGLEDKFYELLRINNLSEIVTVLPWLSSEEVDKILNESSIYLSTSRYEGLPTVLLLAMNYFLPVVATNVDGNKDVVEDGKTGFLCKNADELAAKILYLASSETERKRMGENGYHLLLDKFNIKKNIKILENSYLTYCKS